MYVAAVIIHSSNNSKANAEFLVSARFPVKILKLPDFLPPHIPYGADASSLYSASNCAGDNADLRLLASFLTMLSLRIRARRRF